MKRHSLTLVLALGSLSLAPVLSAQEGNDAPQAPSSRLRAGQTASLQDRRGSITMGTVDQRVLNGQAMEAERLYGNSVQGGYGYQGHPSHPPTHVNHNTPRLWIARLETASAYLRKGNRSLARRTLSELKTLLQSAGNSRPLRQLIRQLNGILMVFADESPRELQFSLRRLIREVESTFL